MNLFHTKMKNIAIAASLLGVFATVAHAGPQMNEPVFSGNVQPDITSKGMRLYPTTTKSGMTVVKASDAKKIQNGKCVYDMVYQDINVGKSKAGKHINIIRRNGKIVKRHQQPELQAGQRKKYKFEIALGEGINTLQLNLDDGNLVNEANENNNQLVQQFKVVGSCMTLSGQVDG